MLSTWWARHGEMVMWVTLCAVLMLHLYDRSITRQRAVDALLRDGYTNVHVIGSGCTVTRSIDKDGDEVDAWACPR